MVLSTLSPSAVAVVASGTTSVLLLLQWANDAAATSSAELATTASSPPARRRAHHEAVWLVFLGGGGAWFGGGGALARACARVARQAGEAISCPKARTCPFCLLRRLAAPGGGRDHEHDPLDRHDDAGSIGPRPTTPPTRAHASPPARPKLWVGFAAFWEQAGGRVGVSISSTRTSARERSGRACFSASGKGWGVDDSARARVEHAVALEHAVTL